MGFLLIDICYFLSKNIYFVCFCRNAPYGIANIVLRRNFFVEVIMSVSLGKLYDVLITEMGVLVIPRNSAYEVRNLTIPTKRKSYEKIRDTSGTSIGVRHKANALFKKDIYSEDKPAIKDLVERGLVTNNGGSQDYALSMLVLLSVGKLKDEAVYLEKLINSSITYRVAVEENLEIVNRDLTDLSESALLLIDETIHDQYENQYKVIKEHIYGKLKSKFNEMISDSMEKLSIETSGLSLAEILTVSIALCVCKLEITAMKKKGDIAEKQEEVSGYIRELVSGCGSNDLDPVTKRYFLRLWEECSLLTIRDGDDERTQIEKYVYPHFTFNREKKKSPLLFEKGRDIRRILIAESGLGKSSFLDVLTSISVYGDVRGDVTVNENNRKKINELEKNIDLTEKIIPILVHAGEYQCREEILNGLLSCIIGGPVGGDFTAWVTAIKHQSNRRLVIMVDAIDEIEYSNRDSFLKSLNELIERFENVNLLVTCRPIDRSYFDRDRLFRGIEEWRLEPFDREQMKEFIEAKIKADTRGINKNSDVLLDNITKNGYLKELASNPYMLEKILVHDYSTGDNTTYGTVKFLVNNLISRRWDKLFEEFPQIDIEDFTIILAGIAHEMIKDGRNVIEKVDLVNKFMKMSHDAGLEEKFPEHMFREIVSKMNNAAGLLIYENAGYKFQYPIFAQYLSAKWIYDQAKYINKKDRVHDISIIIEDLIPEIIADRAWANTLIILFTIVCEYEARNEFLSTIIFRKIFCMGMGTDNIECRAQIDNIFLNIKQRNFGNNNVIIDKEQRMCIDKYIKMTEEEK